jgi:hypothetical protein
LQEVTTNDAETRFVFFGGNHLIVRRANAQFDFLGKWTRRGGDDIH